jgi:nicotinamide-nucleotide amidase
MAGVPERLVREHGAVSALVAEAMAEGARRALDTDFALSATGLAGPDGGTPEKPVGLVFIGLAARGGLSSRRFQFPGGRESVRHRAANSALDWLRRTLLHDGGRRLIRDGQNEQDN